MFFDVGLFTLSRSSNELLVKSVKIGYSALTLKWSFHVWGGKYDATGQGNLSSPSVFMFVPSFADIGSFRGERRREGGRLGTTDF